MEISQSGKTLIAEVAERDDAGALRTLATPGPVRLPQAGQAEVRDRVELVLIGEPGSPPRIVDRLPRPSPEAQRPTGSLESAAAAPAPATSGLTASPSPPASSAPEPACWAPEQPLTSEGISPAFWSGGLVP